MTDWRTPARCHEGGCPRVRITPGAVYIGSTTHWATTRLTRQEWRDLQTAIRAGEFDLEDRDA